ncbi:MAG: hypothetical protein Q9177_003852 [Variospora cf. flavescens]
MGMPTSLAPESFNLLPRGGEGEPYTCPDPSGASSAKQKLLSFGAQPIDMAVAMLENGCAFTAAYSAGNNKQDDAAELGVYRNNWHMIRTYCEPFKGASAGEWFNRGQELHNDVQIATACQRQLWDALGPDQYFSLQRGGLGNMGAGSHYKEYVYKYLDFLNRNGGEHLKDGMATYWNVASM